MGGSDVDPLPVVYIDRTPQDVKAFLKISEKDLQEPRNGGERR